MVPEAHERSELERMARQRTLAHQLAVRAKVILLAEQWNRQLFAASDTTADRRFKGRIEVR